MQSRLQRGHRPASPVMHVYAVWKFLTPFYERLPSSIWLKSNLIMVPGKLRCLEQFTIVDSIEGFAGID